MLRCIVRWLGPWCTWQIRDQIFDFVVNTLRHVHLMVAKNVVRYLKGTIEYWLKYDTNQNINLEGYVDSYWVGTAIDRKSTSRCYFSMIQVSSLGLAGWSPALCWVKLSKKMSPLAIWDVVCFFWKLLFDLLDLACIFYMMQRGVVNLQFVIQIEISWKREF